MLQHRPNGWSRAARCFRRRDQGWAKRPIPNPWCPRSIAKGPWCLGWSRYGPQPPVLSRSPLYSVTSSMVPFRLSRAWADWAQSGTAGSASFPRWGQRRQKLPTHGRVGHISHVGNPVTKVRVGFKPCRFCRCSAKATTKPSSSTSS